MRLFLASSFDKVTDLFLEKAGSDVRGKRVLFVENASDVYDGNPKCGEKWWVENDRKAFAELGCEITPLDLRKCSPEKFEGVLQDTAIVHFCGGSVLYLVSLLKEKKLDGTLSQCVQEGKVLYTGTSAGSMVVAKDLSLSRHDKEEELWSKGVKDFSGLAWTDFFIIPHINNAETVPGNKNIVEALPGYGYPVLFLSDTQAIWAEDKKLEVLVGK